MGRRRRQVLGGVLLGLVLSVVSVAGLTTLWPRVQARATPIQPERPKPPPVFVEVTRTAVLVDGQQQMALPDTAAQARYGLTAEGGEPLHHAMEKLTAAIHEASRRGSHEPGRLDVLFAPDTPAHLVTQVWMATALFEKRFSVRGSAHGPATTIFSPARSETHKPVLDVEVRTHGVALGWMEGSTRHSVGSGCVYGGGGLAVMLRKPADYEVLRRCFESLRTRVPAGQPAHPHVWALEHVPAAKLFYVVNLLRCGDMRCREDQPRLWDMMSVSSTDEYSHAPHDMIPIFMVRLEPALRACYESQRAQLNDTTYETDLWLDVDEQGKASHTLDAGLPGPLASCVAREIEQAHITLPQAHTDTRYAVPLVFGP